MPTIYVKYIPLLCLLVSFSSYGQKHYLIYAEQAYAEKDYYGAALYYKQALDIDPSNIKTQYAYAEALKKGADYEKAARQYKQVFYKDSIMAFPESAFWLGMMLKNLGNYNSAHQYFEKYSKQTKNKNTWYYKKANQEIEACKFAQHLVKDSVLVEITNAGTNVNTDYSEIGLCIINDTTLLYSTFQDETDPKAKTQTSNYLTLHQTIYKNKEWQKRTPLFENFTLKDKHIVNACSGYYNNRLYFTACDNLFKCDIYYTEKEKGPQPLNINLEGYTTTNPSIVLIDGVEVLLFSSDRPGGEGGLDIWYSMLQNGSFSAPKNLGPTVNTLEDEISPYYDAHNKILYFSSNWHKGLGGYDIFQSKGSLRNLSTPKNLGYPINSSANDLYFKPFNKEGAVFISNRTGSLTSRNENCCNDIWLAKGYKAKEEKPPKADTIQRIAQKTPVAPKGLSAINLYFHNDQPDPNSILQETSQSYEALYTSYIDLKPSYLKEATNSDISSAMKESIQHFFSSHVEKGMQDLKLLSGKILEALEQNHQVHITLSGHASPLASNNYNFNLTLRRIRSIKNYLKTFNGGVLKKYIDTANDSLPSLVITEVPYGAYKTNTIDYSNQTAPANDIYSTAAAKARRVEMQTSIINRSDTAYAHLFIEKPVAKTPLQENSLVTFLLSNTGNAPLKITDIKFPKNLTLAQAPDEILPSTQSKLVLKVKNATSFSEIEIESNSYTGKASLFILSEPL
ncbi:hypothetical protein RCC89_04700 [Cytophagaceae bacterium ABcell3]|nr:hypothetical protein RCC89_04700 [Cytophagaceae bacterium ABcell3]